MSKAKDILNKLNEFEQVSSNDCKFLNKEGWKCTTKAKLTDGRIVNSGDTCPFVYRNNAEEECLTYEPELSQGDE